jgi:putative phosphoribosyl transferase
MQHVHPLEIHERLVHIPIDATVLAGNLAIPPDAPGVVLFAHGSGSSRHSPRNRYIATELQRGGLGTLLMDLLTPQEEQIDEVTGELRFNIEFLAQRLIGAIQWLQEQPAAGHLAIGCFGASTGGGAALVAAARRPDRVRAVVSRGGRPDLAGVALEQVRSPTLLIVGGNDPVVLGLNQQAMEVLRCEKQLQVIPGATHLFEEPGALEEVARLAWEWFAGHLKNAPR